MELVIGLDWVVLVKVLLVERFFLAWKEVEWLETYLSYNDNFLSFMKGYD
jgi:hypothetical protein